MLRLFAFVCVLIGGASFAFAQAPSESEATAIRAGLVELQTAIGELKQNKPDERLFADVEIYAKAVE